MPNQVTFTGWDEFIDKVKDLPAALFEEIDGEVMDAANKWEALAKDAAPFDQGRLKQEITTKKNDLMHWDVNSNSEMSAVMEWGTGHYVKVPADLTTYASQFKGKPSGGTAEEAIKNLVGWVKRKGIRFDSAGTFKSGEKKGKNKQLSAETTAQFIFHFIMLHGVKPHPFFFQHMPEIEKLVFGNVKRILERPR